MNWFWWIVQTSFSSSRWAAQDDRRRGRLVDVSDLEADDAVLDVVDDADAVAGSYLPRALDQRCKRQALAVE